MTAQGEVYPGYGFGAHAGYGVAKHRAAIEELGVTPLHRLSFAPLAKYRTPKTAPTVSVASFVTPDGVDGGSSPAERSVRFSAGVEHETTKKIGDRAETEAANYLVRLGHEIIERNWKTKYCEIDIVSRKAETLYFTEVKYRRQGRQGGGLAAITAKKLAQMRYAAEFYIHNRQVKDVSFALSAISMCGESPEVDAYIDNI